MDKCDRKGKTYVIKSSITGNIVYRLSDASPLEYTNHLKQAMFITDKNLYNTRLFKNEKLVEITGDIVEIN